MKRQSRGVYRPDTRPHSIRKSSRHISSYSNENLLTRMQMKKRRCQTPTGILTLYKADSEIVAANFRVQIRQTRGGYTRLSPLTPCRGHLGLDPANISSTYTRSLRGSSPFCFRPESQFFRSVDRLFRTLSHVLMPRSYAPLLTVARLQTSFRGEKSGSGVWVCVFSVVERDVCGAGVCVWLFGNLEV